MKFLLLPLFFVINKILASELDIYGVWPWFDIPMHAIGGFLLGYVFERKKWYDTIGTTSLVIIAWELYELYFQFEHFTWTYVNSWQDVQMGLLGATAYLLSKFFTLRFYTSIDRYSNTNQS